MRIIVIAILALVPLWSAISQEPGAVRSALVSRRDSLSRVLRALDDSIAQLSRAVQPPSDSSVFGNAAGESPQLFRYPREGGVSVRRGERLEIVGLELDEGGPVGFYWIVKLPNGQMRLIEDHDIVFANWRNTYEYFRGKGATTPLTVFGIISSGPNSVGGVEVSIAFANRDSVRTLKYIHFTVTPYNAVGDAVASSIGRESTQRLSVTGPIAPRSKVEERHWAPVWYNSTVTCLLLNRVDVEYMDGSKYSYVRELPSVLSPAMRNSCAVAR